MKNEISQSTLLEYFNGELDDERRLEVEEWAASDSANSNAFDAARFEYTALRWGTRAELINGRYSAIGRRLKPHNRSRMRIAVAAVVALLIAGGGAAYLLRDNQAAPSVASIGPPGNHTMIELSDGSLIHVGMDVVQTATDAGVVLSINVDEISYDGVADAASDEYVINKIIVPRGARQQRIVLSDGSVVWLNSDSRMSYPLNFHDGTREVFLSGEAYFEVSHDEEHPFVVHTDDQAVTVLGTQFNVSAYPGDRIVQTTLVTGKVKVATADNYRQTTLFPGQQAMLDVTRKEFDIVQVNTADFTSWKDGVTSIEKMNMEQVLAKVSRRYDTAFEIKDRQVNGIVLRGSIPVDESLDVVLSVLEKAGNVKFEMEKNGEITVKAIK